MLLSNNYKTNETNINPYDVEFETFKLGLIVTKKKDIELKLKANEKNKKNRIINGVSKKY